MLLLAKVQKVNKNGQTGEPDNYELLPVAEVAPIIVVEATKERAEREFISLTGGDDDSHDRT
jgi:hypothetical protein